MVEEVITKKGTLGQIGFITPSPPLFVTISGAATVATFVGLAVTFYNANTGKMTARYVVLTSGQICAHSLTVQGNFFDFHVLLLLLSSTSWTSWKGFATLMHACMDLCRDANRYRDFLGINKEAKNIADSQKTMKMQGDPVSRAIGPDNLNDIAAARKDIPADK